MAMAWCGYSRKGRQYRASSGGGAAGWSVSTSIPYILWLRCSNKALRPFSRGVYGWVFCAKNWLLRKALQEHCALQRRLAASAQGGGEGRALKRKLRKLAHEVGKLKD